MIFDEAGTYQIEYTATDECGNTTNVERTVIVEEPPTYRTVLYTDGTFIINESSRDEAANIEAHGVATNVYVPLNGDTHPYEFGNQNDVYWAGEVGNVTNVCFGSEVHPTRMSYWFYGMSNLVNVDFTNMQAENISRMLYSFSGCSNIESVDFSSLNLSSLTSIEGIFSGCSNLSNIDFGENTLYLSGIKNAFEYCTPALETLDISMFDTSNVTNMSYVFRNCTKLKTVYASDKFDTDSVTSSTYMFNNASSIVGGAGTAYNNSNPKDKTYARIDNPPDAPGYFTAKS